MDTMHPDGLTNMTVVVEDGYVKVYRGKDLICAAIVTSRGLDDLTFMEPRYQKSNRTRQAACRALQAAGY
jgi:hypothetical protein